MRHDEIWDDEAATEYDTPGTGMFAPDVLGPTVERLAELAGGGRVLEFAIGTGRVAVPLVQRGVLVVGIEKSTAMLQQLRTKLSESALPIVLGDMASARAPGAYSLVYLVFNGVSNLLTAQGQLDCFRNAARHLTSNGRFVVELWVPRLPMIFPDAPAVVTACEPGYLCVDVYDVEQQHVVSHHISFGDGREARIFRSPHRYVPPDELDQLAARAGFTLESRYADWSAAPFTRASASHVSTYRLTPS